MTPITKLIQALKNLPIASLPKKMGMSSLDKQLAKGAAGTFGLKISATGLNFITSVILARILGATEFGIYTYALSWAELLIIPGMLGLDALAVREVAVCQTRSAWGLMRGFLRSSNTIVFFCSTGIALIASLIATSLASDPDSTLVVTFWLSMIYIPLACLRNLRLAAMRGLNQIVLGLTPEMLLAPVLMLMFLGCFYWFLGNNLTAPWATLTRLLSTLITLLIGVGLLHKVLPQEVKQAPPQYQVGTWLRSTVPFIFLGSMYVINTRTDILMLGAMQGPEAAGIYTPISRGIQLLGFVLIAIDSVLAPVIAGLYAEGQIEKLKRLITNSARGAVLASLPIAIGLIVLGRQYLLLFGSEFTVGYTALAILCVGHILNAAMGSTNWLLNMTGHERYTMICDSVTAILNVILNFLLIPRFGINGAAIATAIGLIFGNSIRLYFTWRKLKIDPSLLGLNL